MKQEVKITAIQKFPNLSLEELSVFASARRTGKSSLANWIPNPMMQANSKKYDRAEIAKEMNPILRLMKKIGYEI